MSVRLVLTALCVFVIAVTANQDIADKFWIALASGHMRLTHKLAGGDYQISGTVWNNTGCTGNGVFSHTVSPGCQSVPGIQYSAMVSCTGPSGAAMVAVLFYFAPDCMGEPVFNTTEPTNQCVPVSTFSGRASCPGY